ncbi:MAG: hypothetical protein IKI97_03885 [Clostridia bacterium]|nr:hypothetical protein [Clostridia bacterium]
MNNISLLKKCKIKLVLCKLRKQGVLPQKYLIFSPVLLVLDLMDDMQIEPINSTILNMIIFQIKQHLNIQENLTVGIAIERDMWQQYSDEQKPVSIKNNKILINISHYYNCNEPENSMSNIEASNLLALLCKEITRWFLEKNNIFLKSEFYVEMAMCLLGMCKEAHFLPYVGTSYFKNGEIEHQSFFTSTKEELSYALTLCRETLENC